MKKPNLPVYENGDFAVYAEQFGAGNDGFAVYKAGATCSYRVASIGYRGTEGLNKAKVECDRRATESK